MKKKAWHLLSNPWNSAITEYALNSCLALSSQNFENTLTPLEGSPAEQRAKLLGIKTSSVKNFSPFSWSRLKALYKELKPDVVFLYGGKETSFARFFTESKVIRFRGDARDTELEPSGFYYKLTQGHVSAVTTPCELISKKLESAQIPYKTIPLGVNTEKFRFFGEEKENERLHLHLIARLDPVKGHKSFLRLYSLLLKNWGKARRPFLNILGQEEGVSARELRDYASNLGLQIGLDFQITPYRIDNIQNILAKSDLVVIPSLGSEVICRVAEEALLCGVKVFVSGVGALEECLKEETFGVSYKGKNEKEALFLLQETLETLIEESLAEREKRAFSAKELFSLESMGKSLATFIDEIE